MSNPCAVNYDAGINQLRMTSYLGAREDHGLFCGFFFFSFLLYFGEMTVIFSHNNYFVSYSSNSKI